MLTKNLTNFNLLPFYSIFNLLFFFNFNTIYLYNTIAFASLIKKIINLNFYKIIKKNIFLQKKKSKLLFNNNHFFFFNKIKPFFKLNLLKKKKLTLTPKFFFRYYSRFFLLTHFSLIGVLKSKFFLLNEKSNFFFLKNNQLSLKLKKKKTTNLNINTLLIKNIINFFFYLNKKKKIKNTFLFKISSEFFIKTKTKFSRKNNFSKNFLFLNNSNFSKFIRFKFNDFTEIALSLENFYFPFYVMLKKKVSFFKNYKNKYFHKSSFYNKSIILKKKNIKKFNKFNIISFFVKKKNLLSKNHYSPTHLKPALTRSNNFRKINFNLKKKTLFSFRQLFLNLYLKKNMKKKIKLSFSFLNSFFYLKKMNSFFLNNFNFKNLKTTWLKKKKYKSYKSIFIRSRKNLLFFSKKHFFLKHFSFFLKKNINYLYTWNLKKNFLKIYFNKSSLFLIERINIFYQARYSSFKNNNNKFSQNDSIFYLNSIKPKITSIFNTDIYFFSKNNYYFFHKFNGFFYLQNFSSNLDNENNPSYYKKIIYSFLGKNDLQRYILRKYLKNFSIFNNDSSIFLNENFFFTNKNNYISNFNNMISQTVLNKDKVFFEKTLFFTKNFDEESGEMNIRKIKFKPGYMSLWREARSVLNKVWNLNFRYQQRLTKHLLSHQKHVKHFYVLTEDFKLLNILIFSRITPDMDIAINFIKNGLVFVNGFLATNNSFQIFKNDFIQCVVSIKYYILYRTLLNFSLLKKIRLRHKSRSKLHSFQLEDNKQRSHSFSYWTINNKNILLDVPNFLEVDYFTLSIFCLLTNININVRNPYSFIDIRYGVLNLYNWKYIN